MCLHYVLFLYVTCYMFEVPFVRNRMRMLDYRYPEKKIDFGPGRGPRMYLVPGPEI
jgi:hypothetical protein